MPGPPTAHLDRVDTCQTISPSRRQADRLTWSSSWRTCRLATSTRAFGDPEKELYDFVDFSAEMNLKPALLTDWTYVWATDLPYHVARYHARMPRSFLLHARKPWLAGAPGPRHQLAEDTGRLSSAAAVRILTPQGAIRQGRRQQVLRDRCPMAMTVSSTVAVIYSSSAGHLSGT